MQALERFVPAVRRLARHSFVRRPAVDIEDAVQDGMVGIVEAARIYDSSRGLSPGAYVLRRAKGAIIDGVRRMDPLHRHMRKRMAQFKRRQQDGESGGYLHARLALAEATPVDVERVTSRFPAPDEAAIRNQRHERLMKMIARLPEKQRRAETLVVIECRPMREAAAIMGISEGRVSQLCQAAFERMFTQVHGAREGIEASSLRRGGRS